MSKYNFSCTVQNIQHIVDFGLLENFLSFRGQNKNKNAEQNIIGKSQHRQQRCKVLKECFKKYHQKLIEV